MNLEGIEEEFSIYGMLFSLSNRIQTYGDSRFNDMTMKQHFMMIALDMFGENSPTLKDMGELIGCSYQNVKRMAINLEKNGYLRIETDANDKRKIKLISTGKFAELANTKQEETQQFMSTLYKGTTKEQLKITLQTLMIMDRNIGGKME